MEIVEEEYIDPREKEPAVFDLSLDKMKLLEKRGFFPTTSGLIDDTYYTIRKEIRRHTHLQEMLSVQDLVNMSFDDMERVLFMKDSMIGMPVTFLYGENRWIDTFGGYRKFFDVDPLCLEPFIAKYVRSINRCGMETFFSCDGWHKRPGKSREIVILFRDRYSWIWHKVICKLNNIEEFCCWEHKNEGSEPLSRIRLPRDDERKIQIYNGVLLAADMFIDNIVLLKRLKTSFLLNVHASEIDALSDCGVEEKMKEFLVNYFRMEDPL